MTRSKAIALGIFTAWPFVYMFLFMGLAFTFVLTSHTGVKGRLDSTLFMIIFPLHMLTMLVMFALLAIYIYDLYHTDRVPEDKKTLWAVVLFMGNIMAMPVYWYYYIWKPLGETAKGSIE